MINAGWIAIFTCCFGLAGLSAQFPAVMSEDVAHEIDSLRALLHLPLHDSVKAEACIALAGHFVNNRMDSVMHHRSKAIELCNAIGDVDCVMYQSRLLAYSHINAGEFARVRALLELNERHFTEQNDTFNLSNAYIASGFLYRRMGEIERALEYFYQAAGK